MQHRAWHLLLIFTCVWLCGCAGAKQISSDNRHDAKTSQSDPNKTQDMTLHLDESILGDLGTKKDWKVLVDHLHQPDQISDRSISDSHSDHPTVDSHIPGDAHLQGDKSTPVSEICNNAIDDNGNGLVDCVDLNDCGNKTPCVDALHTIVVHEVHFGSPNYIVLRNASTAPRNLANYQLEFHGKTIAKFTLPTYTLLSGDTVAVFENQSGGVNDINMVFDIPYENTPNRAFVLWDPNHTAVDYIGFGSILLGIPAGVIQYNGPVKVESFDETADSYYRAGMKGKSPTFYRNDWVSGPKSKSR